MHLHSVFSAFFDLSAGRPWLSGMVMVPGAIPFAEIDRWCERKGIVGQAFDDFHTMIRAMDKCYIDDMSQRATKKPAGKTNTPTPAPPKAKRTRLRA